MKLLKTRIKGTTLTINYLKNDKYIGQRIALDKYEPYLTKLMLRQIKEGDAVVDVGANIGFDTVLFAKKAGVEGRVYAFEPDPVNFEILQMNIKENGLTNVTAVQSALGAENGEIVLYKSEENLGDHRVYKNTKAKEAVKVSGMKLDSYMEMSKEIRKVSVIKIDTQGWEPAVLRGAKKTLRKDAPTIFLEFWPWAYKQAGLDKAGMLKMLREAYGQINYIDEYIQIYYPVSDTYLDKKYKEDDEIRYGNVWVKKEKSLPYFWGAVKDFWPKKLAKRILGRPQT